MKRASPCPLRVTRLQAYEGLRLVDITEAMPGDIVIIAGMDDVPSATPSAPRKTSACSRASVLTSPP